ncbi:DUF3592 domain-containing protein [Bradyrhizobium guangzhouense]|uniref:DUF3592 domain-containing protein n=1 Tax=Bradyrhizobium guangzhouense TaxID=1325095 RepID=A0AAE5X088_9BRAD|nr:DUF3592 domain-containing protein [Bradyrhizobium guangzhouense]QAU46411.1 DUF3592 domain-containing protein [Bradyrhizobium guangzhouense]RXH07621.1 DUF3592 domain-containing protein [Bradyrhizobium guangzhouense]RXH13527.1 DUF3592 domain-containing protein [Bradyrhizobium guangzhouense]
MLDAHQLLWTQIAAGFCLLICGAVLFNLMRMRGLMQAARDWDKVEGVITVSGVDQPPQHASDDLNDATPIIRYRYRAGGRDLESDQVAIGGQPMMTRVLAGKLVGRYPVGAHVDVYVDPKNPEQALLEPAEPRNITASVALAIAFGLAAAVLIAHSIAGHVLYTSKGVPLFLFPLPILALLGAISGVVAFFRARQRASASMQWPTTAGIVTACDVIEEAIAEKSDDKSVVAPKMIHRYQLDLRYAYRVDKRDFVGTEAHWGMTAIYGRRDVAEKAAGRYHRGQAVTVSYDPERPGTAVLEPDRREGSSAPLVLAAICAVIGGIFSAFFILVGFD